MTLSGVVCPTSMKIVWQLRHILCEYSSINVTQC